MHEDIDDFEPDWDSYYSMSNEEREVRREKGKLFSRYVNGKINYETYLEKIDDPYFYGVLDDEEWKEIQEHNEEKNKKTAEIAKNKAKREREWANERQEKERILKYIIWAIILISMILIGLGF